MAKKKSLAAGRRALALFLAFSLVLTMMSAAPVGPVGVASAQIQDCSEVDEFFWVISIGLLNEQCDSDELSEYAQGLEDDLQNSTKLSIHQTAGEVEASQDQYLGVTNNYLQDSRSVAMSKAEKAIIEAIDDGDSKSQAKTEAKQAVQDYYTRKQMNLNDHYITQVEAVSTMEAAQESAGFAESFVDGGTKTADDGSMTGFWMGYSNKSADPVTDTTVTTINGSTLSSRRVAVTFSWDTGTETAHTDLTNVGSANNGIGTVRMDVVTIEAIDDNPGGTFLNLTRYVDTWNAIDSQSNQMESNAEVLTDSIWNATVNGSLNTTDVVSGSTLAQEYSTEYNSTGFYSYAVGMAAASGYGVPDLETTRLMTIQTASNTYQGLLMTSEPPDSGVFEVGVTYNALDIGGPQFVATTDGDGVELTGEFSITSMEGPDGESVESTTVQEADYTVVNSSANYTELQNTIKSLRDEIASLEPLGGSGGGGGGFDFNLGSTGLVVIAAGAAAVLLLGRN